MTFGLQGHVAPNKNDPGEYINPPADPRLNSILVKTNSPLKQGIIQQTDDVLDKATQRFPYACRFMFNPNAISVHYETAQDVLPPGQLTTDQLAARAIYPGATAIGFSLLFDRTYEVAYGPNAQNPVDLRKIGVYRDIAALEAVTGVLTKGSKLGQLDTSSGSVTATDKWVSGNMLMMPVYVIFGGGLIGGGNAGMAWVAYINSMDVTYTLFSQNMVPTRAVVNLNLQQIIGRSTDELNGKSLANSDFLSRALVAANPRYARIPR